MIQFKDFLKSRNLPTSFFSTMSYLELSEYCRQRSVKSPSLPEYSMLFQSVPLENNPWVDVTSTLDATIVTEPTIQSVQIDPIEIKKIRKYRKDELQKFCNQRGIIFSSDDTKKNLIKLLKDWQG